MLHLKGIGTAIITPFTNGAVDYKAYKTLIDRQSGTDVRFIVALGTTAETSCLTEKEKINLLDTTMTVYNGPVVVGAGTNSLQGTIDNFRALERFRPDAWLVVVPYYNRPTQEGLYQYYSTLSCETDIPIILYNVPGRTGTNMLPETTARLSELPNIIGIKEAAGIEQCRDTRKMCHENFFVFSGNDDQWLSLMPYGIDGVISVASNVTPGMIAEVFELYSAGNLSEAQALNEQLIPLYEACFFESNPIAVKGALSLLGLCNNELRLPLTSATSSTLNRIKAVLDGINNFY